MKKKGFVFTLIALMLFSSLFIITAAYLKRNVQAQQFISESTYANKVKFIRENVVSDFYTMLDIDLDIIDRDDNYVYIQFQNFSNISLSTPYVDNLSNYENYIENDYSDMINTQVNLTRFVPEFEVYPYNSTFLIDRNRFYLYTNDFAKVVNLSIDIKTNASDLIMSSFDEPTSRAGGIPFRVKVYNATGGIIVDKMTTMNMSEESTYNRYFFIFNNSPLLPNMTLEFGRHRQIRYFGSDILTNGTLYIETNNMEADIQKLWMTMDTVNEKVVLRTTAYMFID